MTLTTTTYLTIHTYNTTTPTPIANLPTRLMSTTPTATPVISTTTTTLTAAATMIYKDLERCMVRPPELYFICANHLTNGCSSNPGWPGNPMHGLGCFNHYTVAVSTTLLARRLLLSRLLMCNTYDSPLVLALTQKIGGR